MIHDFARAIGDQTHLDYLYLLTVADVRGTNPKLWNSWKASLFHDFYERTKRALRRGLESAGGPGGARRRDARRGARAAARDTASDPAQSSAVWARLNDDYFLRHTPAEIAWHTRAAAPSASPATTRRSSPCARRPSAAATAVLTFMPHRQHNFARTTALLDQMGLNILDARITPLDGGLSLDTYLVLEDNGAADRGPPPRARNRAAAVALAADARRRDRPR